MRKTIAIAANEIVMQRTFLGAAAVISLLALVAPYVPGFEPWDPAEVRLAAALFGGGLYCAVAALVLGGGVLVRELAEGRLGFHLARPVSTSSICFGKLLGAYLTVIGCELLVAGPAVLLHRQMVAAHLHPEAWHALSKLVTPGWAAVVALGLPLPFLLLGHVAALIWRGRTVWLSLDLIGLLACGLVGWHAYTGLAPHLDDGQPAQLLFWYLVAAVIAMTLAGWRATSVGRADLQASHRGLSLALWPLVALVALGASTFTQWETAVTPFDLAGISNVKGTPSGDWILVRGSTARPLPITASFLYHGSTGENVRLPLESRNVRLSADGRAAAWLEPIDERRSQVMRADLQASPARVSPTSVFADWYPDLLLSEHGERIAISDQQSIAVYETRSGKLVISFHIPQGCYFFGARFDTEAFVVGTVYGTMSVGEQGENVAPALEDGSYRLDVEAGTLSPARSPDLMDRISRERIDAARDRALVQTYSRETSRKEWLLVDWPRYRVVTRFPGSESWRDARLLADGRIAYARTVGGRVELGLLDAQGRPIATFDLGRGSAVVIGGEPAPGVLAVGVLLRRRPWETPRQKVATWAVDLTRRDVREIGSGLVPVYLDWSLPSGSDVPAPGSLISRCFIGERSKVVAWDPSTDGLTTVVPPSPQS